MHFASKLIVTAITLAVLAGNASAQQKITIGGTPNSGPATAMVAVEEGIFQKHGLDATYTLIAINPSIPPALLAGSLQIGIPTPTTFLQAVDGGLDLVVIAGVADNSKARRCKSSCARTAASRSPRISSARSSARPASTRCCT